MKLLSNRMASPIGELTLVWDEDNALCALGFDAYGEIRAEQAAIPSDIRHALEAYFDADFESVNTLPVRPKGTPFQQQVWTALREIPVGTTMSYGELARKIGRPGSSRAVGSANGANPIAIVVPCHRVIGADGRLTGYGGGIDRKRWLLEHERGLTLALKGVSLIKT